MKHADLGPAAGPSRAPRDAAETLHRTRRTWQAIAAVCALAAIAAVAIPAYSWAISQSSTTTWSAVHPITAVDIVADDGSLAVHAGAAGRVSMTENLSWNNDKPQVTESWAGDVLKIQVSCTAASSLLSGNDCSTRLDLAVPAQTTVTANSVSGDISAVRMAGKLWLTTQSGDVTVGSASGPVEASTVSGDISATGLAGSPVTAESRSGDVTLGFAAAPALAQATADSGNVTVLVPPGSRYRVSGGSNTGDWLVDASLDQADAAGAISARSTSGAVVIQYQNG